MYNMARMKELYEDVREMFEQGLSDAAIAYATGQPIELIQDCTAQFEDELDEEQGFDIDLVAAEDFAFDEVEY
jgi:hypothetical protein